MIGFKNAGMNFAKSKNGTNFCSKKSRSAINFQRQGWPMDNACIVLSFGVGLAVHVDPSGKESMRAPCRGQP